MNVHCAKPEILIPAGIATSVIGCLTLWFAEMPNAGELESREALRDYGVILSGFAVFSLGLFRKLKC